MHSQTDDIIVVTRQFGFSKAWDAYITISRCCYTGSDWSPKCAEIIELPGSIHEICLVAYTEDGSKFDIKEQEFVTSVDAKVYMFDDLS